MTPAWARSLWLAGAALLVACSSSGGSEATTTSIAPLFPPPTEAVSTTSNREVTTQGSTTSIATTPTSASANLPTTIAPIDPALLIAVDAAAKPLPAAGDELATQYHGFVGDPLATLQNWLIMPMAVPIGPDVRVLGFERTVGINTTTATYLTGAIEPDATLATIAAVLAPAPTYTVTTSTRTEGTVTIHTLDAQPNTVQGEPPGWSIEASVVDKLGIVRIKRSDYSFDDVVPTFEDLPPQLQSEVVHRDAIAVNSGGVLSSITYEYGVGALGDDPVQRTRLTYDVAEDLSTANANLSRLLTSGWDKSEETDAVYFTSATSTEIWTLDDFGGTTHLIYDTGG